MMALRKDERFFLSEIKIPRSESNSAQVQIRQTTGSHDADQVLDRRSSVLESLLERRVEKGVYVTNEFWASRIVLSQSD